VSGVFLFSSSARSESFEPFCRVTDDGAALQTGENTTPRDILGNKYSNHKNKTKERQNIYTVLYMEEIQNIHLGLSRS